MAKPVTANLPPDLDLADGYVIRLAALDPTTGAAVASVVVTDVSLFGTNLGGTADTAFAYGPFMLVPGPGA